MHKVIYIEWQDAVGADGWSRMSTIEKEALAVIKTAGFLIKETKESVTVLHSIDVSNEQSGAWMVIPKAQIKKRKFLKL